MVQFEDIEPYLIDYLHNKADEANTYRIKAYLQAHPEFQSELDALADSLHALQEMPTLEPPMAMKRAFYAHLHEEMEALAQPISGIDSPRAIAPKQPQPHNSGHTLRPLRQWATAAMLIGGVVLLAWWQWTYPSGSDTSSAPISATASHTDPLAKASPNAPEKQAAESVIVPELQSGEQRRITEKKPENQGLAPVEIAQAKPIHSLYHDEADVLVSPSTAGAPAPPTTVQLIKEYSPIQPWDFYAPVEQRLSKVYGLLQQPMLEKQLAQQLVNIIRHDPSPNVRTAALDVWEQYGMYQQYADITHQLLNVNQMTVVQINVIDQIVKHPSSTGVLELQKFIADSTQLPIQALARQALDLVHDWQLRN